MDQAKQRRVLDSGGANVYALMEDVLEKLKILDYETKFLAPRRDFKPLHKCFFSVPTTPSEQFPYFAALAGWLLTVSGIDFVKWSDFDEDPNSISQSVLSECERLGFRADFPVSKLRHGSGDAVCAVLNFLSDCALKKMGFAVVAPIYTMADFVEEAQVDEEAEIGDECDEIIDEAENVSPYAAYNSQLEMKAKEEEDRAVAHVVESNVDPAKWSLELERVGPMLKWRSLQQSALSSHEWRSHLDQSSKHESLVNDRFQSVRSILISVGTKMQEAVERIAAKESHINKDFEHLGTDFRTRQKALDTIQERYNELSQSVTDLTAELSKKTEAVEQVKSQMTEHNDKITDTSPLNKISSSLAQLRKEITDMELRIGVVSQTLLQRRAT
uniref:Intraflagellar transport protein 57 homolog n=1 Tax=Norrisiella sphaerica TaxID=552664 RepID=A0A7S2VU57_9EUKA|mmetsp:Transcript_1823/g.2588  ORF Transcript_1823/g.2588 Transcript_1823/m.2588 type:complete len:386 (+) Transcript_1823:165-1322(+)|eukprot:CAMPEP_0184490920 /NCGR_PEP_ID=MMETSP0113_2-20130426/19208_1 /TAXON_ID=91329 /ORGANISM="Norrisiella sphaerica, Strain BC52" /LENGTH=385 /DNA_ID=CAMNT_0026875049 /DNA_START=100 /DNA_END=1257 /DNA_ORIENTATION=-